MLFRDIERLPWGFIDKLLLFESGIVCCMKKIMGHGILDNHTRMAASIRVSTNHIITVMNGVMLSGISDGR